MAKERNASSQSVSWTGDGQTISLKCPPKDKTVDSKI